MGFLDKNKWSFWIDRLHEAFVFVAPFDELKKAMRDVVGKITDKSIIGAFYLDFVFVRQDLNRLSDVEGGKDRRLSDANQRNYFGLARFFDEEDVR